MIANFLQQAPKALSLCVFTPRLKVIITRGSNTNCGNLQGRKTALTKAPPLTRTRPRTRGSQEGLQAH